MRTLHDSIETELLRPHDEIDVIGETGAHVFARRMLAADDQAQFHFSSSISRPRRHCLRVAEDASSGKPHAREEDAMTIEPMLTEEMPANALVARVLEEAGI